MIRGTTPTLTLHIKDNSIDLTQATKVYVTIKQFIHGPINRTVLITKTGSDIIVEAKKVSCYLTQEESLKLQMNSPVKVQINWLYGNSKRAGTKVKEIMIGEQLLEKVLS